MEQHLTTANEKNDLPLQAGNNPLSNNPAGSADIEKGKPKAPNEKPDIVTPETEKPDVHEMPKTTDNPEVEKTDIEEVPDTEIEEIPDTEPAEMPDTHIEEMPEQTT
jgi:hypothetical protein